MLAGAASRTLAQVAIHPLDTLKTRMQVRGGGAGRGLVEQGPGWVRLHRPHGMTETPPGHNPGRACRWEGWERQPLRARQRLSLVLVKRRHMQHFNHVDESTRGHPCLISDTFYCFPTPPTGRSPSPPPSCACGAPSPPPPCAAPRPPCSWPPAGQAPQAPATCSWACRGRWWARCPPRCCTSGRSRARGGGWQTGSRWTGVCGSRGTFDTLVPAPRVMAWGYLPAGGAEGPAPRGPPPATCFACRYWLTSTVHLFLCPFDSRLPLPGPCPPGSPPPAACWPPRLPPVCQRWCACPRMWSSTECRWVCFALVVVNTVASGQAPSVGGLGVWT